MSQIERSSLNRWPLRVGLVGVVLAASLLGKADDTDLFLSNTASVPPNVMLIFGNTCGMYDLPCARFSGDTTCGVTQNGTQYFNALAAAQGFNVGTMYACPSKGGVSPDCFDTTANNYANDGGGYYQSADAYQEPSCTGGQPYQWANKGTFAAACNNDATCMSDLTSYGYHVMTRTPVYPFCEFAVAATSCIQMGAGTLINSYNSSTGVLGMQGNVGGNTCIAGDAGVTVQGAVGSAGGGSCSNGCVGVGMNSCNGSCISNVTSTGGNYTTAPALAFPPLTCSSSYTPNSSMGACKKASGCSYSSASGVLSLGASGTVSLPGGTYSFQDLQTDNGATLSFTGPATVYVAGHVCLAGGTNVSPLNLKPANLTIFVCGTDSTPSVCSPYTVDLDAGPTFYGVIYAPNGTVRVDDPTAYGGSIHGSVVGAWMNLDSNVKISYDEALPQSNLCSGGSGGILFSGNLLNFYPPKFAVAEKAFNSIIDLRSQAVPDPSLNIRMSILDYSGQLGASVTPKTFPPCSMNNALPMNYNQTVYNMQPNVVGAPLGAALLNTGQYYDNDCSSGGSISCPYYTCLMQHYGCAATSANGVLSPYLKTGGSCTSGSDTLCQANNWTCEKSDAIIISDGEISNDGLVPPCIQAYNQDPSGTKTITDAWGVTHTIGLGATYAVSEAASWLANVDLRPDASGYLGCSSACNMACQQAVNTYALIFRTATEASDIQIEQINELIEATDANHGNGTWGYADSFSTLMNRLLQMLRGIVSTSRTFSAPFIPTLTMKSEFLTYMSSFVPAFNSWHGWATGFWEGHLRAYPVMVISMMNGNGLIEKIYQVEDACKQPITSFTQVVTSAQCGSSVVDTSPTPLWDAGECLKNPALVAPMTVACKSGGTTIWPACYLAPDQRNILTVRDQDVTRCQPASADSAGEISTTWVPAKSSCVLSSSTSGVTPLAPVAFTTADIGSGDLDLVVPGLSVTDVVTYIRGPKADPPLAYPTAPVPVLGDIFHSGAVLVSASPVWAGDSVYQGVIGLDSNGNASYGQFIDMTAGQPQIVLAGANDGMLHAFDAGAVDQANTRFQQGQAYVTDVAYLEGTGKELWAFIPHALLAKLQFLIAPPPPTNPYGVYITSTVNHPYFVDAPPEVRDVYLPGVDNGLNGTVTISNQVFTCTGNCRYWHTVVIGGLRLGGMVYYALDISDRTHPKFLWEFSDPELAYTWEDPGSSPAGIGPVAGFQLSDGTKITKRFVAIVNGGLSVNRYPLQPTPPINQPDNLRGRSVYLVDVATGSKIWQMKPADNPLMAYSIPGSPQYVDYFGNAEFTGMVGADLGGNVWLWDFHDPSVKLVPTTGLIPNQRSLTPSWPGYVEYAFGPGQPFWSSPQLSSDAFQRWMAFLGSGDNMNPLDCPASPFNFFGLVICSPQFQPWVNDVSQPPFTLAQIPVAPLPTWTIGSVGWRDPLTVDATGNAVQGQKVMASPALTSKVVLYNSYVPSACGSLPACQQLGGSSILNARDYLTGGQPTGAQFKNLPMRRLIGSGIPGAPKTSTHIEGNQISKEALASASDGTIISIGTTALTLKTSIGFILDVPASLHNLLAAVRPTHLTCP